MSLLIVQIYKLSHTVLRKKARVVNVKHDLLLIVSQVNQSKTYPILNSSHWNPREKGRRLDGATSSCCWWHNALLLRVAQSNLLECKKVMYSRICTPFYLFVLNSHYPDHPVFIRIIRWLLSRYARNAAIIAAACQLRSLRSNKSCDI